VPEVGWRFDVRGVLFVGRRGGGACSGGAWATGGACGGCDWAAPGPAVARISATARHTPALDSIVTSGYFSGTTTVSPGFSTMFCAGFFPLATFL